MPSISLPGFWGSNAVLRLAQWALYWAVALVPMQYFSTLDKYLWGVFNCSLMCYAAAVYHVSAWGEGRRWRSTLESWLSPFTVDSGDWAQVFRTVQQALLQTEPSSQSYLIFFHYFPHLNLNSLLLVNMSVLFIQLSTPQNKYWANETMILNPTWWYSTETNLPPRWHVTCLKWILTVRTQTGNGLEHADI